MMDFLDSRKARRGKEWRLEIGKREKGNLDSCSEQCAGEASFWVRGAGSREQSQSR